MLTEVDLPSAWEITTPQAPGSRRFKRVGSALELEIEPLRLRMTNDAFEDASIAGATSPARIRVAARARRRTHDGWSYEAISATIVDGSHVVEERVVALFEFLHHVCSIRIRAHEPGVLELYIAELDAILDSARPAWSGDAVALVDLWREPSIVCSRRDDVLSFAELSGIPLSLPDAFATGWSVDDPRVDFGRVVTRVPRFVFQPHHIDDVVNALRFLRDARIPVVVRGAAYSVGGQTLSDHAVIDLRYLNRIVRDEPDKQRVTVGGGCTWLALVDHLRPQRRRPVSLVDCAKATVGGVLAVGGVGDAAHTDGLCTDHVTDMVIITPDGEVHHVGPDDELFRFTLGGRGQLGIIAAATLRTVTRSLERQTRRLAWRSLDAFVHDAEIIATHRLFDTMRSWLERGIDGQLGVIAEVTCDDDVSHETALAQLDVTVASKIEPIDSYTRFVAERRRDSVTACPSLELLLPLPHGIALVERLANADVMSKIPYAPTLGLVRASSLPLAPLPSGGTFALAIAFRPEVPLADAPTTLDAMRALARTALAAGAKIQLGSIDLETPNLLDAQFGNALARFLALKDELDPRRLFARWSL
jgi:FAD/FMN-containing dehydrogenase